MMLKKSKVFQRLLSVFIVSLFFLTACGKDDNNVKAEKSSPEYTATMFFYAVLADKDLKAASSFSSTKLDRLLKSYGSAQSFSRHILNMRFDSVEIQVEKGRNLRERYDGSKAVLNLLFTGLNNGNKVDDFRTVELVKHDGKWLVDKIRDDPFAR